MTIKNERQKFYAKLRRAVKNLKVSAARTSIRCSIGGEGWYCPIALVAKDRGIFSPSNFWAAAGHYDSLVGLTKETRELIVEAADNPHRNPVVGETLKRILHGG